MSPKPKLTLADHAERERTGNAPTLKPKKCALCSTLMCPLCFKSMTDAVGEVWKCWHCGYEWGLTGDAVTG